MRLSQLLKDEKRFRLNSAGQVLEETFSLMAFGVENSMRLNRLKQLL